MALLLDPPGWRPGQQDEELRLVHHGDQHQEVARRRGCASGWGKETIEWIKPEPIYFMFWTQAEAHSIRGWKRCQNCVHDDHSVHGEKKMTREKIV